LGIKKKEEEENGKYDIISKHLCFLKGKELTTIIRCKIDKRNNYHDIQLIKQNDEKSILKEEKITVEKDVQYALVVIGVSNEEIKIVDNKIEHDNLQEKPDSYVHLLLTIWGGCWNCYCVPDLDPSSVPFSGEPYIRATLDWGEKLVPLTSENLLSHTLHGAIANPIKLFFPCLVKQDLTGASLKLELNKWTLETTDTGHFGDTDFRDKKTEHHADITEDENYYMKIDIQTLLKKNGKQKNEKNTTSKGKQYQCQARHGSNCY